MTEQLLEGVKPTRMELLSIRKKLSLAEKGHNLLEQKRDSLVERFFSVIDKRNDLVNDLDELFKDAFQSLIQAQMIMGEDQVDRIARLSPHAGELEFTEDNIMGVKIPKMDDQSFTIPKEPSYGMSESCAKLDDSQQYFRTVMQHLLKLADLEGGIKSLAVEIEKTKRRVNVLENNLIPKLKATQKYIEMQLEEREREDFFRRKRIKALMESEEE
ncbi:MAG: V-type ATP synthase subunit D [Candidatus Thermoplasmatota archaeon]|nr:V-type ATP synthase subunit D [Candidatus Thermoplasmatota archaeon]